jgi:hypothetical protein
MQTGVIKFLVFDDNVKDDINAPIFSSLVKNVKNYAIDVRRQNPNLKTVGFEANLSQLAEKLSELNQRLAKAVKEIIFQYNTFNPEVVKTMGKKNNMPYDGDYIDSTKDMKFDLKNLPDTLIIILIEFIRLHAINNQ